MKTLKQLSLAPAAAATPLLLVVALVMASTPQPANAYNVECTTYGNTTRCTSY